jgi:DNA-binding PadR family transcriptional regulator
MNRPVPVEVVLGLLKAQPAHGYELLEWFRSKSLLGRIWTMSTSQLYAVLKRLESDGAILGEKYEDLNAPPRVEYHVTPYGDQQLNAWLSDPKPSVSIHLVRVIFLSRVFIANLLGLPTDAIVAAQFSILQEQLTEFERQRKTLNSEIEGLTLDFIIGQLQAAINWLNHSNFNVSIQDYHPTPERKNP